MLVKAYIRLIVDSCIVCMKRKHHGQRMHTRSRKKKKRAGGGKVRDGMETIRTNRSKFDWTSVKRTATKESLLYQETETEKEGLEVEPHTLG